MEIVEALEIKGRPYRYRATIRWGESSRHPIPLCDCKQGHASKAKALKCKKAQAEMPAYLRDEEGNRVCIKDIKEMTYSRKTYA